ncbi:uridine kinase [Saccharomonospora sp. NPDC046836]|uniref:uridine kinase n=1 Tax=Saccharomonospora sp. NPDC046836 TaxID=3156921 RepID=UPI0033F4AF39
MSVQFRPVSPERLVDELAERISELPQDTWARIAVDGADTATDTTALADALTGPLRLRGREVQRVSARDFLRAASLRFERGRYDPDVRYTDWLDTGALRREVLDPLAPDGSGTMLPALWDPERDRAYRLPRTTLPAGAVLLLDGELLLGRGFAFDLTVHLWLSAAALRRRLPTEQQWALPAYDRYDREVDPAGTADVVVRMDHPRHPAIRNS